MVSSADPNSPIQSSCSEVVRYVRKSLSQRGLQVLETFDLQTARPSSAECSCHHHGSAECDCQMVVLLVYSEGTPPTAIMLHGNDGQTWMSLPDEPKQGMGPLLEGILQEAIRQMYAEQSLSSSGSSLGST